MLKIEEIDLREDDFPLDSIEITSIPKILNTDV